jgi:Domain of unknown function (DUF4123)
MDTRTRDSIISALWPSDVRNPPSVWALLDLARDPRIYQVLFQSRLEFLCLYSGRLPRRLELAAPHMVELLPRHPLVDRLVDEGWGRSWGVFVKIHDPTGLRRHLRRFLKVRDEEGRELLFRFYDPRVLRLYLPTCRRDELAQVFGPVMSYLTEGPGGETLIEFRFDGTRLVSQTRPLPGLKAGVSVP